MASSVVGVIEPALEAAETARSTGRPTADLTAYDLYLRAHAMYWSSARQIPEALGLAEQAIDRDRHYGSPLSWPRCAVIGWLSTGGAEIERRTV